MTQMKANGKRGSTSQRALRFLRPAGDADGRRKVNRQRPEGGGKGQRFRYAWTCPWTKEEDALLGKCDDRELVEKLNRTAITIKARRHQLGIPAWNGKPQPLKLDVEVLLATKGHTLGAVVRKRHILGKPKADQ